jgi:hypothetical protein
MVDLLEGNGEALQRAYGRRFTTEPASETTAGNFTIRSYLFKGKDFTIEQQHITSKKFLYILTAAYRSERPEMVEAFFTSYRLFDKDSLVFPKGIKGSGRNIPFTPVEVEDLSDDLVKDPDQKAVLLYRPRPAYNREFMKSNSGTVTLKQLLSADGSVKKIDLVFTPNISLFEGVRLSAQQLVFLPATKGGRPVTVEQNVEYGFRRILSPIS